MSDRRWGWATASARVVIGTVVAAGFATLVVSAVAAPWPAMQRDPLSVSATPAPAASVLSCSGSLLALGRNAADAASPVPAAAQDVTSGVRAGDAEPDASVLAGTGALGIGGTVLTAPPEDGRVVDLAAAGSAAAADKDLRGFAASACRPPQMESWLIGGATTIGSADIVLLGNPGRVAATVQLTVYGASGPAVPPGGADLTVPAGSQLAVPLAGLSLGNASPVVRVTAAGAPVTASLQTSLTRTLVPVGVDEVGAVTAATPVAEIPGVTVTGAPGAADPAQPDTLVRILSPAGETTATVTVSRVGATEPAAAPSTVPLGAGTPVEVDLSGLAVGQYTVRVEAALPIIAAVRQVAGEGETADYAWYTSAPTITASSLFATPAGPSPTLTLIGDGGAEASVELTPVDGGAGQTIVVPAGGSVSVALRPETVYALDPGATGGVHAQVSLAGDGALAGYAVWPSDAAARAIAVYP